MSLPLSDWKQRVLTFLSQEKGKVVVFVNMREDLPQLAQMFRDLFLNTNGEVVVVCLTMERPVYFRDVNIGVHLLDDHLVAEDYEAIDRYVLELTRSWYLPKGEGLQSLTEYRQIHLGNLVEYDFQAFLAKRIRNLELVQRVIKQERPERLIAMEDTGELGDIIRFVGQTFRLSALILHHEVVNDDSWDLRHDPKSRLAEKASHFVDRFMQKRLWYSTLSRRSILIDSKLYPVLNDSSQPRNFLQAPLVKGLRIRLELMKKSGVYVPFAFPTHGRRKKTRLFEQRWKVLQADKAFQGLFCYQGLSIWSLVEERLAEFFLGAFPRIARNIDWLVAVHAKKEIQAVVLRNDVRELEKTIVKAAKMLNIPSLVIQHGILALPFGHELISADKMAVWGPYYVDWYQSRGNSRQSCVVTGNPHYDQFCHSKPDPAEIKQSICRQLSLDPEKGIVLLASQGIPKFTSSVQTDDESEVVCRAVLQAMKAFPNHQLLIKLHPHENDKVYRRLMREEAVGHIPIVREMNTHHLLKACNLVLTINSTLGLETIILGKPLITVNLRAIKDTAPYAHVSGVVRVYKGKDLVPAIQKLLSDGKMRDALEQENREWVQKLVHGIDGRASQRVLDLLNTLIVEPQGS